MSKYPIMDICIYPTSIRFKMQNPYTLENGMKIGEFTNSLTEFKFDYRNKKWFRDRQYIIYEESTNVCSVPRYYLKDFVNYIRFYGGEVNLIYAPIHPGRDVQFKLNSHWKPREHQIAPIHFFTDTNFPHRMKALPLQTALGKSYISIVSAAMLGKPFIVIVGGLIEQWYDVIVEGKKNKYPILDLEPNEVYVIQGQESLVNLIDNKDYLPNVIIASLSTIRNYITADHYPYNTLPNFNELMLRLGIGTKINDEAHRCFATIVDIDLRCNIANNFYLSATLTRGDRQSKKIFMRVFPDIIRYKAPEPIKYQYIYYLPYHIGYFKEVSIVSKRYGYNQNRYENQILNDLFKKVAFLQFIHNQVEAYYIRIKNPGEKCMIMASTRSMCDTLMEYFASEYPNLKINSFYENDTDENTVDADIIIATVGKASTGNDIKELRTLINTISIGSEVLPVQILGRLRQLDKERHPIYVAMYNKTLDSHIRHYKFCRTIYKSRALKYFDLSDKEIL